MAPASGGQGPTVVPIAFINGTLTNISVLFQAFIGRMEFEPGASTGINSARQVVGWYANTLDIHGYHVGFVYANGIETDIAVPCSVALSNNLNTCTAVVDNRPSGINDGGQIAGTVDFSRNFIGSGVYAYVASSGSWTNLGPGAAYAINASGDVTGTLTTSVGTSAFLFNNGTTTNLGTLDGGTHSTGYAINATGQIVGSSDFAGGATTHAFLYNGGMNDLNTLIGATDPLRPFVTLTSAVGINDNTLIVANGVDSRTNQVHAYLFQAPQLRITPGPLSFGTQAVGGMSPSQTVVLTNFGGTAITLGTISVGTNFSVVTTSCGPSLTPSNACSVAVAFSPAVAGALAGALVIPTGGANYQVSLSGLAPIAATISANGRTATVGLPLQINWTSSPGSTCTAADSTSNPAFNGTIPPNGSKSLTETSSGKVFYGTHCAAPGVPAMDPVTSVVWNWPAITATLSASPTTIIAGQSTTLTWAATNATGCTATGGGSGDNWAGAKAASGSQTITEPFATATASVMLTFGITCSSTASGLSAKATAVVTDNSPPSKSGGGAIDLVSILSLLGILSLGRAAKS
ncbi:MAG TPA: choice-of-anchor D domain-containing protein [Steroidobacteraceae bacterium]|nr:choice-of-anchor D domain-containing protein [Steroidobacteraceae bacterium]